MRSLIRNRVATAMDGFEQRQAERNACRKLASAIHLVYHYRSSGVMDTLQEAQSVLDRLGLKYNSDQYYGVTLLSTSVGVVLAYGPTGKFAWGTGPHVESSLAGDQLEIFSDSPSGASSSA